jgi:hypothetical protein
VPGVGNAHEPRAGHVRRVPLGALRPHQEPLGRLVRRGQVRRPGTLQTLPRAPARGARLKAKRGASLAPEVLTWSCASSLAFR